MTDPTPTPTSPAPADSVAEPPTLIEPLVQPTPVPPPPAKKEFGGTWWLLPLALIGVLCLCSIVVVTLSGLGWAMVSRTGQAVPLPLIAIATPSPIATATPILATPTSAIAPLTATAQADWPVLNSETFDLNLNNWQTFSSRTSDGNYRVALNGGKYQWSVDSLKQAFFLPMFPQFPPVSDFRASVDTAQLSGANSTIMGIVFRADDTSFYGFFANGLGEYRFFLEQNTQLLNSQTWTAPNVPLKANGNRLGVSAIGSHFIFYLNDQIIGEADDSTLTTGQIGLAVGVAAGGDKVTVEFDNFELRAPAYSAVEAPTVTSAAVLLATQAAEPNILKDTFTNNTQGWATGNEDNSYISIRRTLSNGQYDLTMKAHQGVFWEEAPTAQPPDDLYFSVEAQVVSAPDDSDYGIVFRNTDAGDLYYFSLDNHRTVVVGLRLSGEWTTLLVKFNNQAVQLHKANQLGVVAQGAHFTFYINDQYVGEVEDSHLRHGYAGLAFTLRNADDRAELVFSNFQWRSLSTVEPATHTPAPSVTPSPTVQLTAAASE